ncbi:hypothetical protein V5F38_00790 [Xanthobacter sp. V0B-10]|uniref:hypothetical protein n=1 Tax=Xanthobacter albus TaxID=3119929 RepID=UPI0037298CFC
MPPVAVPHADLSRFAPLAAPDLLLACLGGLKTPPTRKALATKLKTLLAVDKVETAASALAGRGLANVEAKVVLTEAGREAASMLLGRDTGATWDQVRARRILPLCLGLDPNAEEVRNLLAKPDGRRSAIIAVAFGLPQETRGIAAVCEELVWQTLKAGIGSVLGSGRLPPIKKPGITEWIILAGLGGLTGHCPTSTSAKPRGLKALTGAAVGLPEADDKTAVTRAITLSLGRAAGAGAAPVPTPPSTVSPAASEETGFADRVRQVAQTLTTPPFQGRVAIAQVYDAYGREHPDAGSLQSFKERLIAAAHANRLELGRVDVPERMDREMLRRSEAAWGNDRVHFIITGRR